MGFIFECFFPEMNEEVIIPLAEKEVALKKSKKDSEQALD